MCLLLRKNFGEFLEITDASASKKLEQFVVAVTWLNNVNKVVPLTPRDNSDCRTSKFTEKSIVRVDLIQQLDAIDRERAHPSYVQRTIVTVLSSDI